MEFLADLGGGFGLVLTPLNLALCLLGVAFGTAVGVLPGLGPTATISLLLPVTLAIDHKSAVIMLAGIYYGAMYGGSITAVLIRIPGEASSIITCVDGYEMGRQGRAGAALGMSAFASFIAGVLATFGIGLVGPQLAEHALAFGPVERTALVTLGLVLVAFVSQGSRLKAFAMALLGLLLSTVGTDVVSGIGRYSFDSGYLLDGLNVAIVAMGLFGIAEVLALAERHADAAKPLSYGKGIKDLLPNRTEWRRSARPIARGSIVGFLLGLLPGGGAIIASFVSYVVEKRSSRMPEEFGKGAIEGVAGPESANNAAAQAAFVPLLCLGIPSNAVMGVIMGALLIHGVTPGPRLISENPDLFWGVVASMFIGNLMLVILNVPLVGLFVSLLRVPQGILSPLILLFCIVGAYSLNNNVADVAAMMGFGLIGLVMRKLEFDPAPLILAFILGSMFEQSFRQGLLIGYGDPLIFLEKPISAFFLGAAALVLIWPLIVRLRGIKGRVSPIPGDSTKNRE